MGDVVKLAHISGNCLTNEDLATWLEAWAQCVRLQKDPIRTLYLIGERKDDAALSILTTGYPTDRFRHIGLLQEAVACMQNGDQYNGIFGELCSRTDDV